MPSISGKYQHYKNENVDEYFSAIGVPYIGRKMMTMSSPIMEITVDGDDVTIKNSTLMRTVELKFKFGEEYEEKMPNNTTIKSVTTKKNDNEWETSSVVGDSGVKAGRHYLFTDDECVITLTHENAAPGKRYFRRVQ